MKRYALAGLPWLALATVGCFDDAHAFRLLGRHDR
jgi:hypothetical protein